MGAPEGRRGNAGDCRPRCAAATPNGCCGRPRRWGWVRELTLADAAEVCGFLAEHEPDSERTSRAAARLAARITMAARLGLEDVDELLDLVANLPDADRLAKLLLYARRADEALHGGSPTPDA